MTALPTVSARALAAVRLQCERDLAQAGAQVAQAGALLLRAERKAGDAQRQGQELARWARQHAASTPSITLHAHLLAVLAQARRRAEAAALESGQHAATLSAARQSLALVRAREKALDRLVERIAQRRALGESRALAREQDEQWLQGAVLHGSRA